jgi:carbonic anhydrase
MKSFLILVIFFSLIQSSTIFAAIYSYNGKMGPAFWNETCKGKNQSPIDISYDEFKKDSKLPVEFQNAHNVDITNDGHTIEISNNFTDKLNINGSEYKLSQFHFHTPSEHRVNGIYHDVEAHFVFVGNQQNQVSVIGVFYDVSVNDNKFFVPIISNVSDYFFLYYFM